MIPERPTEPGRKKALAFTLLVHLALAGALFLGVQWKRSEPDAMQVELWSPVLLKPTRVEPAPSPPKEPVPEPKKPEPPPPKIETPKKPEIVVKEEKKKKPEPKKPEPPKAEPKKIVPPKPKADPFKEMLERENRERQATAEQNRWAELAEKEQQAAAARRGLESYAAKIRGKVRGNIVLPPSIAGNPEAVFNVTQLPTGEVLGVSLKRSSGNTALDAAIERAILKSSPLPKPDDPSLFQRVLEIRYRPFEE